MKFLTCILCAIGFLYINNFSCSIFINSFKLEPKNLDQSLSKSSQESNKHISDEDLFEKKKARAKTVIKLNSVVAKGNKKKPCYLLDTTKGKKIDYSKFYLEISSKPKQPTSSPVTCLPKISALKPTFPPKKSWK